MPSRHSASRRIPRFALAAWVLFGCAAAHAADIEGNYAVVGLGMNSCRNFLAERETVEPYVASWVHGYITAANRLTGDTYDYTSSISGDELSAMIVKECEAEPDIGLVAAVQRVLDRLYADRATARPAN